MATIIIAICLAISVYVSVGFIIGRRTNTIEDMLPLMRGSKAHVENAREFSASTVATTISLATVVIAFFELAPYLGLWLLWCVVTTSLGLVVVRAFAGRIWQKLQNYNYRPTLHEFLGTEFNSQLLRTISATCVSLGLIGAFAVELTVGSRFFSWLVPSVPSWVIVVVLSIVAFFYTASGGFRAVIVTDRIQMASIWLLLTILPVFYIVYIITNGGWTQNLSKIPEGVLSLSYREGLTAFLLGIFVINVPTFISDMTIWQRIAGTQKEKNLVAGLWFSVTSSAITWAIIALLACFALIFQSADSTETNPLVAVLVTLTQSDTILSKIALFLAVVGLYGAMLSTASTQLIAVSHTVYEDIASKLRKKELAIRLHNKKELRISRTILIIAAVCSTVLVEVLSKVGFSIADLVFAIYGAQLGLSPLVILALLVKRETLGKLSIWATCAVGLGFAMGWGTAIYGRLSGHTDIVWLSPVSSLIISAIVVMTGFIKYRCKICKAGKSE